MMRLTKYTHSCVRLERDGGVLVVDPGMFSERAALDGVDAILITHEHPDHVDVDAIGDALGKHPQARIYTNDATAKLLSELGDVVTTVDSGHSFEAAGIAVRAFGSWHGVIHPDLPPVPNLGFLLAGRVFHPGDSFDVPDGVLPVDTLFVPVTAPWLKASEAVDYVRAMRPRRAYALHDSLGTPAFLGMLDNMVGGLGGADYARLAAGETIDVPE